VVVRVVGGSVVVPPPPPPPPVVVVESVLPVGEPVVVVDLVVGGGLVVVVESVCGGMVTVTEEHGSLVDDVLELLVLVLEPEVLVLLVVLTVVGPLQSVAVTMLQEVEQPMPAHLDSHGKDVKTVAGLSGQLQWCVRVLTTRHIG
jgi:hypothetical protein